MLETDVGFNRNMLRYTSDTLKEHNAEIISLKSQIQAAYEQTRTNESKYELSQNLIAQLTDQLEVAQNSITENKIRLGEAEIKIHENAQKISLNENKISINTDKIAQNMEAITGLDLEAITGLKERLAEVEGTTT